jgi:predicted lactoylglutathione lyase
MAAATSRKLFVNLAVKDLAASVEFFTRLGFRFDQRFTDENATCMLVGEDAFVMLLVEGRFRDFTGKAICDPTTETEAILALTADSKEAVEELADLALAAGGTPANEPMDYGFMYGRSFNDVDGHLWEVFWMDESAFEAHEAEAAPASRPSA